MKLTAGSSKDFEVEFDIPINPLASNDTTRRTYGTVESSGDNLSVPVVLDGATVILLDHVKVANSPWGAPKDLDIVGSVGQLTFAKVAQGWEITLTIDAVTGSVGGSQNQTTISVKLNERAVPYDLTITGTGSMDKSYRTQGQSGVTITAVAYRVTHP